MLHQILESDTSVIIRDAPDWVVSVQGALLATLKGDAKADVKVYEES